jgi:hypothetical protein
MNDLRWFCRGKSPKIGRIILIQSSQIDKMTKNIYSTMLVIEQKESGQVTIIAKNMHGKRVQHALSDMDQINICNNTLSSDVVGILDAILGQYRHKLKDNSSALVGQLPKSRYNLAHVISDVGMIMTKVRA